ncbi:TPA: hypothetical protein ACF3I9_004429 [Klebsiella aerogenes]
MNEDIKIKLQEFISKTEPRGKKSVLHPYADVVFVLTDKNYTHQQISDFFKGIEIHVSRESVGEFIRKHSQFFTTGNVLQSKPAVDEKSIASLETQLNNPNDKDSSVLHMKRLTKKQFTHNPTGVNNE